jgi:predicted DNA-binding ribbon-helix-helix protein
MSVLTIRLPDSKHARLKEVAKARGMSTNKFIEELTTIALAQQDTESRFLLRVSRAIPGRGLAILAKLDASFAASAEPIHTPSR